MTKKKVNLSKSFKPRGLDVDEAKSAAARIMSDPEVALDVHVREELGIDPDDLGGSPIWASISSLIAFAAGAIVPLIPYIVGMSGSASIIASASGAAVSSVDCWRRFGVAIQQRNFVRCVENVVSRTVCRVQSPTD